MLTACKTVRKFHSAVVLRASKGSRVDWGIERSGKHGSIHVDFTEGKSHNELSEWV
jgi:hypothetical protein